MNKLLIVLLAICLVSVHAFVKRDTEPAVKQNALGNIQNQVGDVYRSLKEKIAETLNIEDIKKKFNAAIEAFQNAIKDLVGKKEVPKV